MISATGKSLVIMFPLLLPTWQERPFVAEDFAWGPEPVYVETSALQFQSQGMKHVKPTTKARMLTQMGKSGNDEAVPLLIDKLQKFSDPNLQAAALKALENFASSEKIDTDIIKNFFDSKDHTVRRNAVSLLGKTNYVEPDLFLDIALEDPRKSVKATALQALRRTPESLDKISYSQLDQLRQSENHKVRSSAWALSCCTADVAAHKNQLLTACKNGDLVVRQSIAEQFSILPEELAHQLLELLIKDPRNNVRAILAENITDAKTADKQSSLKKLAKDTDPEVRKKAVKHLKSFPNSESAQTLLNTLGDISAFVRQTAERSLISIHKTFPINKLCADALTADNPKKRCHALRVLASTGTHKQAPQIKKALRSANRPANIAAAIDAAYKTRAKKALPLIRDYKTHASERVRKSVAKALGMFNYKESGQDLNTLINDDSPKVHRNTIISMGRIGHPAFADSIMKVLKSVENTEVNYDKFSRIAACWAAAHIKPTGKSLAKRLKVQATERVIAVPMGPPAYENQEVMIACDFALAEMAKQSDEIEPIFKNVIQKHAKNGGSKSQFPNTPKLKEYARQAKAFYNEKKIKQKDRPTKSLQLIYEQVK